MLTKIFTLQFSEKTGGFDDEHMRAFMVDKNILSVRDQFFIKDNVPYWSIMLVYTHTGDLTDTPVKSADKKDNQDKKEDYRKILTDEAVPLFNLLREWRNESSAKKGLPPYILFSNEQLAMIAVEKPDSINRLSQIKGIGDAKLEKYGKDVLKIIQSVKTAQPTEPESEVKKNKQIQKSNPALSKPEQKSSQLKNKSLWDSDNKKENKNEP